MSERGPGKAGVGRRHAIQSRGKNCRCVGRVCVSFAGLTLSLYCPGVADCPFQFEKILTPFSLWSLTP